ncbi:hypothetical protein [Pelomonas sp. Root1217]|uniref:hypothetical protein n=1 Tax=Pelomonas sp. Root1217 TaxID=1736430 RepID=UPI0012F9817C|nr:hypothetical protein [Pelomonas sp. Root1217]
MNTNPLRHVGQTASPTEAAQTPDEQAGDAGSEARQQNQTDGTAGTLGQHPVPKQPPQKDSAAAAPAGPAPGGKPIRDLKPGEPPPESSAGS